MRHIFYCLACVGFLASSTVMADEAMEVDLRGPAPKVGQNFRITNTQDMKGGTVSGKLPDGSTFEFKLDRYLFLEEEVTVLETEAGVVSKYRSKIVKQVITTTRYDSEKPDTKVAPGPLMGETIISAKSKKGWVHTLATGKPTKEQQKSLETAAAWDSGTHIPATKQKPGDSWDVDSKQLKANHNSSASELSGNLKETFVGTVTRSDEPCAKIEGVYSISYKTEESAGFAISMEGKTIKYRSLKDGIMIYCEGDFSASMKQKVSSDGIEYEITTQGKAKGTQSIERLTTPKLP